MKKIISVFLALVIGFSAFCVNASAASYKVNFSFDYESGYTYVTLKPASGTVVYYTTDGTKADKNDKKYTKKLKFTKPATLKVTVYSENKAVKGYTAKVSVRVKTPSVSVKKTSDNQYKYTYSAVSGADIYYTVNGGTPSKTNGKKLGSSNSITVKAGDVVRAVAVKNGWKNSKVLKKTAPKAETTSKKTDATNNSFAEEVVKLINKERKISGLSELVLDEKLTQAADVRAKELAESFSHLRPDGRSCFTILDEFGFSNVAAAENVAAGYRTPKDVVMCWMNSEGHRNNILKPNMEKIGVGYYETKSGYRYFWTQLFVG